jgi:hypothetical protein
MYYINTWRLTLKVTNDGNREEESGKGEGGSLNIGKRNLIRVVKVDFPES